MAYRVLFQGATKYEKFSKDEIRVWRNQYWLDGYFPNFEPFYVTELRGGAQ